MEAEKQSGLTPDERRAAIDLIKSVQEKQFGVVCDKGKARSVKIPDFHLDNANEVEIKEPEWLIPGYIPKYAAALQRAKEGIANTEHIKISARNRVSGDRRVCGV